VHIVQDLFSQMSGSCPAVPTYLPSIQLHRGRRAASRPGFVLAAPLFKSIFSLTAAQVCRACATRQYQDWVTFRSCLHGPADQNRSVDDEIGGPRIPRALHLQFVGRATPLLDTKSEEGGPTPLFRPNSQIPALQTHSHRCCRCSYPCLKPGTQCSCARCHK
jgi:hypothetical protein